MTRQAIFTKADIRRLALVVKETGVAIEVETPNGKLRIEPEQPIADPAKTSQSALEAWRQARNARSA